MFSKGVKKLGVLSASGLLAAAVAVTPAQADHGHGYVAPLAAFIAFSAFTHHGHHRHYHYHRHHSYHRHHQRRYSHSQGGYHDRGRSKQHRNW